MKSGLGQFLHSIYLNVVRWRSIKAVAVLVPMADIEVLSSLVMALIKCSFKISTWSVGSE